MIKNKKGFDIDNEIYEDIAIEEIDKEINKFHIDKEKIENIKYSFDKERLIKDAIDKAEKDMDKNKIKKKYIKIAASILVLLSIGVYSPALAYTLPPVMNVLEKINDILKVDEISAVLQLDTIIPKAVVEDNKIHFIKITRYKVDKVDKVDSDSQAENNSNEGFDSNKENNSEEKSDDKTISYNEYEVVNLIHQMSNSIIKPADGKKYGVIEITPEKIDMVLNSLQNINNEGARNYLENELTKWKEGNFSNGVQVHNYVWHMLDGQIGIASSLDEDAISKTKKKYFK